MPFGLGLSADAADRFVKKSQRARDSTIPVVFHYVDVTVTRQQAMAAEYERAFAAHWHDLFRFVLAWTNDWAVAEDLVQDSYLKLWRARASIDWTRPVLPWLIVTSRRLAIDRFRTLRRGLVPSWRPTTLAGSDHERWMDVQMAMGQLSQVERAALILVAIDGHTYDEAAVLVGSTAGALRAAVSRARAKLEAHS